MRAIVTIALKDLKLLSRDRAGFFWVLGFPFLMAIFFGSIFGGGGGGPLDIAVVDQDRSAYSAALVRALRSSEALRVVEAPLDSARALVRRGRLAAYVALPRGAGASLGFGGGDSASIELGIDPSRRAERGYLKGLVAQAVFTAMQGQFGPGGSGPDLVRTSIASLEADSSRTPEDRARWTQVLRNLETFMTSLDASRSPIANAAGAGATPDSGLAGPNIRTVDITESESGPRSAYEVTFPSSIMWALIGVCMSFAISIVEERRRGTFHRLRIAPIAPWHIVAGKGLAAYVTSIGAALLLLLFGSMVFGVRITNPPALAAAILASAFCFTGVMMLISVLGRTHQAVAGAGWAVLLVMSMTGGGMVPLMAMPPWMQAVSQFSIVRWGVLAVEGAIWRGFGWAEMAGPLAVLVGLGFVTLAFGVARLRSIR
jgi:ABC-2 type transport system permease protein